MASNRILKAAELFAVLSSVIGLFYYHFIYHNFYLYVCLLSGMCLIQINYIFSCIFIYTWYILIVTNISEVDNMYFTNVTTIEELKKQYRKLAKQYHPDITGDNEPMKVINNEYEFLFSKLSNSNTNNTSHVDDGFRDIIDQLIQFNIDIEICGSWIWLSGNTYSIKEQLKTLGFSWAAQKKQWYWKPADYIRKGKKSMSMDWIRDHYGSEKIETNKNKNYAIAN